MLTKDQYDSIQPYRQVLYLFKNTGTCVGGIDGLYPIYEAIAGIKVTRGCVGCMSAMLVDVNNMIEKYEFSERV